MSRIIWRRAHPVRLPDRINTPPHLELFEAYKRDQTFAYLEKMIAAEIDRDAAELERMGDR